jgi:hypothetical protein
MIRGLPGHSYLNFKNSHQYFCMRFFSTILFFLASLPSMASIVVLNGLSHTHEGVNGVTITGKITVQNNGKKEARIMVYNEDLMVSCEKPIDYDKINSHDRSLGSWIKTNIEEKVLQSNEIYDIIYTLNVPKDRKGSYWSVIMIEGADPIKEDVENGVKIDSKVRYAILVIGQADVVENPKISFEQMKITLKDSVSQALGVKLKNNGIFVVPAKLSVEIYDETGKKIKTVESTPRRVYPEKCTEFELVIKDIPKGRYVGVLIADNGKDLYGANINLEIN